MSKVYISGAITGTDGYMERFNHAESVLYARGHKSVINPARVNSSLPDDTTWDEYMAISLQMLDMCDCIYMLRGWEQSRGANREYGYALGKGLAILYE